MEKIRSSHRTAWLATSACVLALCACNKQPSATSTDAAMVAPPAAALPMATEAPSAIPPAPPASALPPAAAPVAYAPPPSPERYGYVDRAYSMSQAFADTPPDYAVDYQGTRPWIWRADNGAYRIVERLPQGERIYYYAPGADEPFLVQDPDYAYAYQDGRLAGVYGPDGAELADALALRRAEEAGPYLYRARDLYRAAQYQPRQSAYASEWASRRGDLQNREAAWQRAESSNAQWRSWHDAHQQQLQQQWRQERDQRLAYAVALGIAAAGSQAGRPAEAGRAAPNPTEVATRQAAYFAKWRTARKAPTTTAAAAPAKSGQAAPVTAPSVAASVKSGKLVADNPEARRALKAQAKATSESHAAQVKTAEAQHSQQLAAVAQQHEAAAAHAKTEQTQHAQQLAAEAKQHRAAAAQAQSAQAKAGEAQAAKAAAAEAKGARDKAEQARHAQEAASKAKQREAADARVKQAQAKAAQAKAGEAKAKETKANEAQAKANHGQAKPADREGKVDGKKRGDPNDGHPDKSH